MEITLINHTDADISAYEPFFHTIAESAEKRLSLLGVYEISVTFVHSDEIHDINREYRNIDCPTDVISFAINDVPELVDMEEKDLGDLFINIDYAAKQAEEYGHSLMREMGFLFTHGLLHCLGYDHMTESEEKEMFGLQKEILDPIVSRDEK